jgi:hypothetical protein
VLFYRDKGPNGSSLWIAMPAKMINAASGDYGDVVTEASLAIGPRQHERGRFAYRAIIEPAPLANNSEEAVANCPEGARCIANTGFYVVERPRKLLDVPGGSSRSEHLAFMIEAVACESDETAFCSSIRNFDDALAHLRSRQDPVIRMRLRFYFDGEKEVACRLPSDRARLTAIFDYIQEKGWAGVACEKQARRHSRDEA